MARWLPKILSWGFKVTTNSLFLLHFCSSLIQTCLIGGENYFLSTVTFYQKKVKEIGAGYSLQQKKVAKHRPQTEMLAFCKTL